MGAFLDILFASVVGGLLMINVAALNEELVTARHRSVLQRAVHRNSADLQRLLLRDLRMAGVAVDTGAVVLRADSTLLELRGNFARDGTAHTVRWALGDSADATMTENPHDRLLWRTLDDDAPRAYAFGVVDLHFTYLDSAGAPATGATAVRHVKYRYALESVVPYGEPPPSLFVAGSLTPKNLR